MLHYQAVSPDLLGVLRQLMIVPELSTFRLVGGTALALQIGHRTSVDIDLFTDTSFDNRSLRHTLLENFPSFQILWQNENGISATINDVKIDLFNWRVRFVRPPLLVGELRLMSKRKIGAMKLETITDRKTKKDFADIFFLLQFHSLAELIEIFKSKYPFIDYKFVLESLQAVDQADNAELPLMIKPFDWSEAKKTIVHCVNNYFNSMRAKIEALQAERIKRAEELLQNKKKGK